jgi:uncharacterized membrane protein
MFMPGCPAAKFHRGILMKKLTRYFFEGLLFIVPIAATFYIIYFIFVKIDKLFRFPVPGVGFLLTLAIITGVGFIASNLLTRRILLSIERTFARLPLVKMIYTSIKDLIGAFVGEKKSFNKPALVRMAPGSEAQIIGFITRESLEHLGLLNNVAVYVPQSYNFAGNLIIVPSSYVTPLNVDSGTVMAFIVSGGITAH